MVYKRVSGWTTGRSLPVLNFVKYRPPGLDTQQSGSVLKILHTQQLELLYRISTEKLIQSYGLLTVDLCLEMSSDFHKL